MFQLDKNDRQILYQLDLDARQPNSSIARRVRVSKEVVGYRIRRMQEEGAIEGFYVLVDMTRLGYKNGRIFFKFSGMDPAGEQEVVSVFKSHPNAWWVNTMSGSFSDMGIAFWVKDVREFHELKQWILDRYLGRIEFIKDSFYSKIRIWRRHYLVPGSRAHAPVQAETPSVIEGSGPVAAYDSHDLEILSLLTENARMPIVEIASRAGMSPTAAGRRIRSMKENCIILGFRPKIDLSKIGYYWYKVEFSLKDNSAKKQMVEYFAAHPNVVYSYESIGGAADIEIELEVEGYEQFRKIIDGIRARFRDAIRAYVYYIWSKEHKLVYFPGREFLESAIKLE